MTNDDRTPFDEPITPEPIDHIAALKAQVNETGISIRIDPDLTCRYCEQRPYLRGDKVCEAHQDLHRMVLNARSDERHSERGQWQQAIGIVRKVMVGRQYDEPASESARSVNTALDAVQRLANV